MDYLSQVAKDVIYAMFDFTELSAWLYWAFISVAVVAEAVARK